MIQPRGFARQFVTVTLTVGALTLGLSGCDKGGELTIMPETTPSSAVPAGIAKGSPSSKTAPADIEEAPDKEAPTKAAPKPTKRARKKTSGDSADTCTNDNIKTTVSSVAEPVNHLLITATNIGSKACYAYSAPTLSFDLSKDLTIEVLDDSTPQAVVWIKPGESAYAGVTTSSAGKPASDSSYTATKMSIWFVARDGDENAGPGKTIPLPGKGVFIDEAVAKVTFWQQQLDSALLW